MPNFDGPPPQNLYPIRFGIPDLVAALLLFGIHLGMMKVVFLDRFYPDDRARIIPAALICAAFAFGAAYLAFRATTVAMNASFWRRLIVLVCFDLMLISVPLALAIAENWRYLHF